MKAIVPMFGLSTNGFTFWDTILANPSGVGYLIANNGNGPGVGVNQPLAAYILKARQAGIKVIGYVYTTQGQRDQTQVENDMAAWQDYGVDGVFIDNFAVITATGTLLSYYQALYAAAKGIDPAWTVVGNPGRPVTQLQFGTADMFIITEGYEADLLAGKPTTAGYEWMWEHSPERFGCLIEQATNANILADLLAVQARNAAYVYVTDQAYGVTPSFWATEQQAIQLAAD